MRVYMIPNFNIFVNFFLAVAQSHSNSKVSSNFTEQVAIKKAHREGYNFGFYYKWISAVFFFP